MSEDRLTQRVAKLERAHDRARRLNLLLGVGLVGAVVMAQTTPSTPEEEIRARVVTIVDAEGAAAATLDGQGLRVLWPESTETAAQFGLLPSEKTGCVLNEKEGRPRVSLFHAQGEGSSLMFFDANWSTRISVLEVDDIGAAISVKDADGEELWSSMRAR